MQTEELKPELLHILRHSLGLDDEGSGTAYRNHYAIGPDCDGWEHLQELCRLGLMKDHGKQAMWGTLHAFSVTEEGKHAELLRRAGCEKLTRSQRRYRHYLEGTGFLSFGEWLKHQPKL